LHPNFAYGVRRRSPPPRSEVGCLRDLLLPHRLRSIDVLRLAVSLVATNGASPEIRELAYLAVPRGCRVGPDWRVSRNPVWRMRLFGPSPSKSVPTRDPLLGAKR